MQWWHSLEPVPRYLVVGHTHRPIIIPLAGRNAVEPQDESLYFNSGTWIGIVEQGRSTAEGFVQRDQVTHVTFYTDGEDVHGPERSQWEFWTGNLRRGPIGTAAPAEPEVKVIAALEPAGNERKSG